MQYQGAGFGQGAVLDATVVRWEDRGTKSAVRAPR